MHHTIPQLGEYGEDSATSNPVQPHQVKPPWRVLTKSQQQEASHMDRGAAL